MKLACSRFSSTLLTAVVCLAVSLVSLARSAQAQTIYVAEYYNERAYAYTASGTSLGIVASVQPTNGDRYDGIAVDSTGQLYIGANAGGGGTAGIRRYSASGALLSFTAMSFNGAVAVGANDTLYVGNYGTGQIFRYSSTGASLGLFATASTNVDSLAFDASGNLYATNASTTVRKFSPTGQDLGNFVTGQTGASGLAFTTSGDLLVVNRGTTSVRRYDANGQSLGVFATSANGLTDPIGIAIDSLDGVYVSNHNGTHVEKFNVSGQDLGSFASNSSPSTVAAYRAIGGAAAPEPNSVTLLAGVVPLAGMLVARRRRVFQPKPARQSGQMKK